MIEAASLSSSIMWASVRGAESAAAAGFCSRYPRCSIMCSDAYMRGVAGLEHFVAGNFIDDPVAVLFDRLLRLKDRS